MKAWFKERWRNSKFFQGMVVGAILSVIPGLIQIGYAAYIAYYPYALTSQRNPYLVDLFDPAPQLDAPWPPIAPPMEPLPRLSAADIDTYFFPAEALEPENGLAIWRFEGEPISFWFADENGEHEVDAVLSLYAVLKNRLPEIPPGNHAKALTFPGDSNDFMNEVSVYLARKQYKEDSRGFAWRGDGPLGERMNALGCVARPDFSYTRRNAEGTLPPEEAFLVRQAFIATRHRLDEPTVDHCLFKALLVALGLHPTEGFFFKEGPVTPAEQARALAALQLVYHPAVKPGMTREQFVTSLLAEGLIDP